MKPVHLQRFIWSTLLTGLIFIGSHSSFAQAQELDSLQQFVKSYTAENDTLVNALARLGYLYNASDPDRGVEVSNRALDLSRKIGSQDGMSRAFNSLGVNYYAMVKYEEAIANYDSAVYYKELIGEIRGAMITEVNIGVIEAEQKSFDRALQRYEKAYDYFEELGNGGLMGAVLVNMGLVHQKMYALTEALRVYILAAEIAEKSDDKNSLAAALNNMAGIYMNMKNPRESISVRGQALELVESTNNKRLKARMLNGMGRAYRDLKQYDSARHYHELARDLAIEIGSRTMQASTLSSLGTVSRFEGDLETALAYYNEALTMRKSQRSQANMSALYVNLGHTYQQMNQPEKALEHFTRALRIAQDRKELNNVANSSLKISLLYEAKGDWARAYEHLKIHKTAMIDVNNTRDITQLSALATRYKTEKENQVVLLEQAQQEAALRDELYNERVTRNIFFLVLLALLIFALVVYRIYQVKKRANAQLTSQNEVISKQKESLELQAEKLRVVNSQLEMLSEFRTGLTQMIAHDMKNPLNAIIGLSGTQPSERNVKKIAESGYQMLNLVTNMLEVEKLEETRMKPKKEEVFIDEIIKAAKAQVEILLQAKSIFIQSLVPRQICMMADKEMMTRVMVNLLTNAIKYSDVGGSVRIRHEVLPEGFLRISVEDDGQGIDPERLPYIFDKFWQSDQKKSGIAVSTGLGLTFCRLAVEAHGGKLWATSDLGKGTTFTFELALNQEACAQFINLEKSPVEQREGLILNKELSMLARYSEKLAKHQVHEVGAITRLIKEMDLEDISSRWKQDLQTAVYEGDQHKYEELLGMLAES